jgi:hypothetical protein
VPWSALAVRGTVATPLASIDARVMLGEMPGPEEGPETVMTPPGPRGAPSSLTS